jgi:ABC-type transport system involved in Fe-S cluster assembly, permease component
MEANNLTISNTNNFITIDKKVSLDLSLKDIKEELVFVVLDDQELSLNIEDFNSSNTINFFANKNAKIILKIINDSSDKNIILRGQLNSNAEIDIYLADFSNKNLKIESNFILFGDNSRGNFKFSSIASENCKKEFNVGFNQIGLKTNSLFEGYGVALKNGEINAKGISHIEKDSVKSIANQKIKVILFDEDSKAKASPTLKIDCDDISANHACAIGSVNEDHIFYLKTRGLSEIEARKLITMGYLLPIEEYFAEAQKKRLDSYIKENF